MHTLLRPLASEFMVAQTALGNLSGSQNKVKHSHECETEICGDRVDEVIGRWGLRVGDMCFVYV